MASLRYIASSSGSPDRGGQRRPVKQQAEHDERECDILRMPDAAIRARRRNPVRRCARCRTCHAIARSTKPASTVAKLRKRSAPVCGSGLEWLRINSDQKWRASWPNRSASSTLAASHPWNRSHRERIAVDLGKQGRDECAVRAEDLPVPRRGRFEEAVGETDEHACVQQDQAHRPWPSPTPFTDRLPMGRDRAGFAAAVAGVHDFVHQRTGYGKQEREQPEPACPGPPCTGRKHRQAPRPAKWPLRMSAKSLDRRSEPSLQNPGWKGEVRYGTSGLAALIALVGFDLHLNEFRTGVRSFRRHDKKDGLRFACAALLVRFALQREARARKAAKPGRLHGRPPCGVSMQSRRSGGDCDLQVEGGRTHQPVEIRPRFPSSSRRAGGTAGCGLKSTATSH